ncbi:MAG TPA: hypothetical protein VHD63_03200 [Ktedonobacteraceae bacterium]|jgi:hypothetical protein|nr:hypothetical protein [Ktedonobacteraceae bacterium]
MVITINMAIILTLICFIGGIVIGVSLIRPRHYGTYYQGRPSAGPYRHHE